MYIRGKAIAIFEHGGKYLFTICFDQHTNEVLYIPVGGGIEFGEYSIDAVRREVKEEIGQETENEKLLSITENIFRFNGINEHEIVFTWFAAFKDKSAYSKPLKGGMNDKGEEIKLVWTTLHEITDKHIRLYPGSLAELLKTNVLS